MNFKNIKKEILKLKPNNVKIIPSTTLSCYDQLNHIIYLEISLKETEYLHTLLHEICHSLTTKPRKSYKYIVVETSQGKGLVDSSVGNDEYKAEKLLRKICKKNGWNDILKYSNDLILTTLTTKNKILQEIYRLGGYRYAAERINKEENVVD